MRRRLAGLAVLALFASAGGAAPSPRKLKLVTLPYLSLAPLFIARAEGFFAEEGLEVEPVPMTQTQAGVPALISGDVDVLPGTITPGILNAIARGGRIRIVADRGSFSGTGCAFAGLVARKALVESGQLETPAQLKGRRIACSPGSAFEYYLDRLLAKAGVARGEVELLDLPDAVRMEALRTGAIDAVVVGEPWLTRMARSGAGVILSRAEQVLDQFAYAFLLYGPNLLDRDPEAGERFMRAYLKGVRRYREGRTERNLAILAAETSVDRATLEACCWPEIRADGQVAAAGLLAFQSWALSRGLVDSAVSADRMLDLRFVALAAPSPARATGP